MPARILSIPFLVAALVFLFLTWEIDQRFSVYLIPMMLILALIYSFSPQINWWWYLRRPPKLAEPLRLLLAEHHPFYQQLPAGLKQRFRDRTALYLEGVEFMPQAMETVPEDVKAVVAASAVTLTLAQESFLLAPFERVVVYPHPFPSPQYPTRFHASEIFVEDSVVLFSMEQLMRGFVNPKQWYPIGLHEFAKVYLHLHPDAPWPAFAPEAWESIRQISGYTRDFIAQYINLPEELIPASAVAICCFFYFPESFRSIRPDWYGQYRQIFGFDPAEAELTAKLIGSV